MRSLEPSNEGVLVLGSLNAKSQDRALERSAVRPVQLIIRGETKPISFFDSWGTLGVSSLGWHPKNPTVLYVSTGTELSKVDLKSKRTVDLGVPNLHDVHELTVIGDTLWLANTGLDEAVAFDITRERVVKRMSLTTNSYASSVAVHKAEAKDGEVEVIDKFHCNQIFSGFDGETYALVHHVSGKQLIRRIGRKLIKNQGNGGVIGLSTGRVIPLGLKGPHSVEKVHGDYWVCDSGRAMINIYDRRWTLQETLSTRGWGRGASFSEPLGVFYAGISETRKRYLGVVGSKSRRAPNMVRVFSARSREPVKDIELSDIEQVNNVYVIPRETTQALLELESDTN